MSAFAHKAGLHASAVKVDPMLYQHIDPALVGNDMRMLVSDMAGRASVELKGRSSATTCPATRRPSAGSSSGSRTWRPAGYTFEAADASFELLLRDELGGRAACATSRRVVAGHRRAAHRAARWSARPP